MSPFKWLSLAVGGLCTVSVAGLMAYTVGPAWSHAGGSWLDLLFAAALVGVVTGGLLHLVSATFERELHHAIAAVQSGVQLDAQPVRPRSLFGLGRLVEAAHDVAASLRSRLRDATAGRRDAEIGRAALEDERRRYELIVHAIDDAVLISDGFNELVFANRAAADLLGFSLHTALRQPIEQVVHDRTLVRLIRDAREAARATPGLRRQVQHRLVRHDRAGVFQVTLQAITAEPAAADDSPTAPRPACAGVVVILHDITQQAETAERRTDFVASVSHELRTPLSSIKGCLEMLMDGEAADEAARGEFYNIIQTETNRLSRLVDNILSISRIESGAARPRPERIDLGGVVQEAIAAAQAHARAKGLGLTQELEDGPPVRVFADREMLLQAMNNLIGNAIKYTPEGGAIRVAIRRDQPPGHVCVAVSDTGIGIPAEAAPHVFEKFYRVADHTRLAKGTGLGLNLVKHVIEGVHGGTIRVDSEVGQGSTFTFTLPMAESDQGTIAGSSRPAPPRLVGADNEPGREEA